MADSRRPPSRIPTRTDVASLPESLPDLPPMPEPLVVPSDAEPRQTVEVHPAPAPESLAEPPKYAVEVHPTSSNPPPKRQR
jgi:hypothetical protein